MVGNPMVVRYSSHDLNNGPFHNPNSWNTKLVRYALPHFISPLFFLIFETMFCVSIHGNGNRDISGNRASGIWVLLYSGDLNSKLVRYSDHGDMFDCQMDPYSDAQC